MLNGDVRLRLPGNSSDEVELERVQASTKPKIALVISDAESTAKEFRKRGLDVRAAKGVVFVTDPDGRHHRVFVA